MVLTQAEIKSANAWVQHYAENHPLGLNPQLFTQYVVSSLNNVTNKQKLINDLNPLIGDNSIQFVEDLFKYLHLIDQPLPQPSPKVIYSTQMPPKQTEPIPTMLKPTTQNKNITEKSQSSSEHRKSEPIERSHRRKHRSSHASRRKHSIVITDQIDSPPPARSKKTRSRSRSRRRSPSSSSSYSSYSDSYSDYESNDSSDSDDYHQKRTHSKSHKPKKDEPKVARYIIYVCGLEPNQNTCYKLLRYFGKYGSVKGIQVFREDRYALVEFNDLKTAYMAVISQRPVLGNKLIKIGFATPIDQEILEMYQMDTEKIIAQQAINDDSHQSEVSDYEYDD